MRKILKSGNRGLGSGACLLLLSGLLVAGRAWALTSFDPPSIPPYDKGGRPRPSQPPLRGVVMEEIKEGSALARAGLEAGDVVLSWERIPSPPANPEGEEGEIASPFDWLWVEVEQAPRGTVTLSGEREGEPAAFVVEPGLWGAGVRPRMSGASLDAYRRGRELIDAGQLEEGTARWRQSAELADPDDWPLRCWLWLRVGQVRARARDWKKAEEAYERAWAEARHPRAQVAVREALGDALRRQSQWDRAAEAFASARKIREASGGETLGVGRNLKALGNVADSRGDLAGADAYYQRALAITGKLAPESLPLASIFNGLGILAGKRGDLDGADAYFQRTLSIEEKLAPNSLQLAATLNNLGNVARHRGDPEVAEAYYQRTLSIKEKLAPNSLPLAKTLSNLGVVALVRGDLGEAETYNQRALSIEEKLAPRSLLLAATLNNLGNITLERGDLKRAEAYFQRDLSIKEKLAPNSLQLAKTLNNLGIVAAERGALDAAEVFYQDALSITEKLAPDSLQVAALLENLGNLARDRRDPDAAEAFYQSALSMTEKLVVNGLQLTTTLNNLGTVARERGNLAVAESYLQRDLSINEKVAPNSLQVATSLNNLGLVALDRGDPERAKTYFQRSLSITEKQAPNSLKVATPLNNLAIATAMHGDPETAEALFWRALAITGQLAPDSLFFADILSNLGEIFTESERLNEAADYLIRAIEAVEAQISRLGVSHERQGGYRAWKGSIYRDTIEALLRLSRPEQAFHVLERFRGRSLLAMVAERDVTFSVDVPEELEIARQDLGRRYDRILKQMGTLDSKKDQQEVERLSQQLQELLRERDELAATMRKISPRLADLRYPRPLTLAQARDALDPGTVMLSYSVGEDRTHVFVVTRAEGLVAVRSLDLGEEELRLQVDDFRDLVTSRADPGSERFASVEWRAREVYERLIAPAASAIDEGDRLLIIPDGPLHRLAWSALIRDSGEYVAEWKPVHFALSATLYDQLRRSRPPAADRSPTLAAFGDPIYPQDLRAEEPEKIADVRLRAAVRRGLFDWESLLRSGWEVEAITALYPRDQVELYLGNEATEERVKGLARSTGIIHFATHGYLDDRVPLNSAVVLTIPQGLPADRDNGLLQAWEIFERLRIDADLVVLSSCRSALGQERGGEGLIGLTRAFQYAGARTVVASLWDVSDVVTPELMVRFHRHLRSGKSKDEALQAAQIDLIREPIPVVNELGRKVRKDASAPIFWAAFQLYGDWR